MTSASCAGETSAGCTWTIETSGMTSAGCAGETFAGCAWATETSGMTSAGCAWEPSAGCTWATETSGISDGDGPAQPKQSRGKACFVTESQSLTEPGDWRGLNWEQGNKRCCESRETKREQPGAGESADVGMLRGKSSLSSRMCLTNACRHTHTHTNFVPFGLEHVKSSRTLAFKDPG